jgi:hypothetical protein
MATESKTRSCGWPRSLPLNTVILSVFRSVNSSGVPCRPTDTAIPKVGTDATSVASLVQMRPFDSRETGSQLGQTMKIGMVRVLPSAKVGPGRLVAALDWGVL